MAYHTTIFCPKCQQSKQTISPSTGRTSPFCDECNAKTREENRNIFLEERAKLTLEERIRKLEEDAYDTANAPPQYVPPPLY